MKAIAVFAAAFCIIASMYGGGFSTVPAYLADIFGTRYVGAIHGRLLTASSSALGPVIVNYLHDTRVAQGVPHDFNVLAVSSQGICMWIGDFGPVHAKWHMKDEGGAAFAGQGKAGANPPVGIGRAVRCPKVFVLGHHNYSGSGPYGRQ